ncbi:MAG: glycosyltransferase family A protein [Mesorhizobium sp.]|nr:glycosyltransferase family A protein [Mesorhizobium sp.]
MGSAVFVGTARDCARYLPAALERWSRLESVFSAAHFIVAENDSVDATKSILAAWAAADSRRTVICLDGIGLRGEGRSNVVTTARNHILDLIASRPDLSSADYLVVMDMDDVSLAIRPETLRRCMAFEGWDGLFANQLFYYYDVWALRHPRSPDDFEVRIEAAPPGWRRRWARLRHLTWRNRPICPFRAPFRVDSAFGGFGIYRMTVALGGRYVGFVNGRTICEHVPYHEQLVRDGARLFIHPGMINMLPMPLYRAIRRWL